MYYIAKQGITINQFDKIIEGKNKLFIITTILNFSKFKTVPQPYLNQEIHGKSKENITHDINKINAFELHTCKSHILNYLLHYILALD